MKKLLLFDIDGTLIRTNLKKFSHPKWFETAIAAHFNLESFTAHKCNFHGSTDGMITLDLLKTANLISESEHKNPSKTTLDLIENISNDIVTKWMVRDLPDKFNGIFQILPGVNKLLSKLDSDDSFQLALLTGNYAVNANLKLIAAG